MKRYTTRCEMFFALAIVAATCAAARAVELTLFDTTSAYAVAMPASAEPVPYVVIVNVDNPITVLDHTTLTNIFLRRLTHWPNGETIRPVDRADNSDLRKMFVSDIFNQSMGAVKTYWQQVIFSGNNVPPPELNSDEAVVRYVQTHRGAVGYISSVAASNAVKVITIKP